MSRFAPLVVSLLLPFATAHSFPLVTCKGNQFIAVTPETGHSEWIGEANLRWAPTNFQFILDEGARYAFVLGEDDAWTGFGDPLPAEMINVTDLLTGKSQSFPQSEIPTFGGFFRGALVIATETGYYAFNPETGGRRFLARSVLDEDYNFQFIVDPDTGLAYQLGKTSAGIGIAVTDLATGESHFVKVGGWPLLGGFFNGRLILAYENEFYAFDPVMGKGDHLATSPLGTGLNLQFTVDARSGYAYMMGTKGGSTYISQTSLVTGESTLVPPANPYVVLSKLYPEVASMGLRRREMSRRPTASLNRFWGLRAGSAELTDAGQLLQATVLQRSARFQRRGMKQVMTGTFADGSRLETRATFTPGGGYHASIRRGGKLINLITGSWRLDRRRNVVITEIGQGKAGRFQAKGQITRRNGGVEQAMSRSDGGVYLSAVK